jgi:hypothetical protein
MDWQPDWFEGHIRPQATLAWRGVEAQHVVSTMRLVDSAAEQDLLEQLLEGSKPALPPAARSLHYLLATPFRYRPPHASRFRAPHSPGQWYGAQTLYAACAEVAYWRHRFILDSAGLAGRELLTEHTFFQGAIQGLAIDLTQPPWDQAQALWTHDSDYRARRPWPARPRSAACSGWPMPRCGPGHRCAVVFDPASLAEPPGGLDATQQTWHCKATAQRVMFRRGRERHEWAWAG